MELVGAEVACSGEIAPARGDVGSPFMTCLMPFRLSPAAWSSLIFIIND